MSIAGINKLEHVQDDRFEVEAGAVEDDRVFGRAQRCDGSCRVGLVPGPYFGQNLVIIRGSSAILEVLDPASSALFGGRRQEELHLRIREDHGANIAAFEDDPALSA